MRSDQPCLHIIDSVIEEQESVEAIDPEILKDANHIHKSHKKTISQQLY
jgi:hypothetical protein